MEIPAFSSSSTPSTPSTSKSRRFISSDSSVSSSSSTSSCASLSYRYGILLVDSEPIPKKPKKNKKKDSKKSKERKNERKVKERQWKQEICACTAGVIADCAAICCCPCAFIHFLVLAFVKIPTALARSIVHRYSSSSSCKHHHESSIPQVRKQNTRNKQVNVTHKRDYDKNTAEEEDDEDENGKDSEKHEISDLMALSRTESPTSRRQMDIQMLKMENERLWNALYEGGHLGFGGRHFASSSGRRSSNFVQLLNNAYRFTSSSS
eukprot:TRINITY_DN9455_c0_g1_i1.p1 TRINITY_DN9455_c0_g1~~TRINITY_DN9455_c0_g1_i1.p1  ORF type:complete len:265 (+),score=26.48 TRINITY_DN9455_c0_g1_i1:486-1280(+)